tara:strand:+ start:58633 stop:58824 length:192 start_codon:yes stop_codon:yes gene_type:complete
MNINRIAQLSTVLSTQQTTSELHVAILKLGNDQIKAEGEAALQLIQALPQPVANVGNTINIAV